MPLLTWLRREVLIALGILVPTTVGLGCVLGTAFFQLAPLDLQMHNTYFVVRPWEIVALLSLPQWLLVQLVRGVFRWLR
ncbi:hypothetical protein HMJ29_05850 [Hymenobacter taeanensis]|uniref:Uncharacterized protein n=1 Tax=Hymenobacter taeanensis TaxID=2735321 RepID=A0A6M6BGV3_9BACT|nr:MULTISPECIES: hypothetical protein [Hymenobacter]QJX46483.1 hypothetical protein HMJ29_05850 [Hymenobacter taeanensis]UOQ80347.1 hypothetical protein MUN83_16170 [Hymenobacter sp. 5414T-23]